MGADLLRASFSGKRLLLLPLILFLTLNLILRLVFSPSLHGDGADILLFNQGLAWGYSEQPPLFSWLFWLWSSLFGSTVFSLALFRAVLFGSTIWVLYLFAFRILKNNTPAVLSAFSLLLFPHFVIKANFMTHTLLMVLISTASLYCMLTLIERGYWRDYLLLGALTGLGILAKHTHALFIGSLVLAGLTLSESRRRILSPRTLVALLITSLLLLPHAWWLLQNMDAIARVYRHKITLPVPHESRLIPAGAIQFLKALLLVAVPLGLALWVTFRTEPPRSEARSVRHDFQTLLERYLMILCGGLILAVFVTRSRRFPDRWLTPFVLMLPLLLFGRLQARQLSRERLQRYAALLIVIAVVLTGARVYKYWHDYRHQGSDPIHFSFKEPAEQLRKSLSGHAVLIGQRPPIMGNLRANLPEISCLATPHVCFQPDEVRKSKQFIVLWCREFGKDLSAQIVKQAEKLLGVSIRAEKKIYTIKVPPLAQGGRAKPIPLCYVLARLVD